MEGNMKIIVKYLRGVLLALLFFAFAFSYAQVDVGGWETSKLRISNKTIEQINGRDHRTDILNEAILLKLQYPDTIVGIHFIETLDIKINSFELTDTLTISGRWHMTGENGNYYRYPACGDIIKIEADSIISWQTDIELIRSRSFGKSTYKDTGRVPFQFVCDTITRTPGTTTYGWQTFATEKHCIKTFIDGVYTGEADESCDPGAIDYYGTNLRRHTNSANNLQPNTTYKILIEGTNDAGDFNIIEFEITTLE